jgi:hypothetical protein
MRRFPADVASGPGALPSPWLEPPGGLPRYANNAQVTVVAARLDTGAYDTNVPPETFRAALERAAKHPGYSARTMQFKAYHADGGLVLEKRHESQQPPGRGAAVAVTRRRPLSWHELPGAPMFAVMYERTKLPFAAFSCEASARRDARCVRRLSLRVHRRADLIFETYVGGSSSSSKVVRRIYLDINLQPDGLDADMPDLRRTVENTVHAVVMGVRLKRRQVAAA